MAILSGKRLSQSSGNPPSQKKGLDTLYARYNRREYVHPDPLEFLYRYRDLRDREIVALIASSLAYGRVIQILRSVDSVLERLGHYHFGFLMGDSYDRLFFTFYDFRYRFK